MLPTQIVDCPYCGEAIELIVDDSVEHQHYVEDCAVCCRPIDVDVSVDTGGEIRLILATDSEV
jgi:hypothetical protein